MDVSNLLLTSNQATAMTFSSKSVKTERPNNPVDASSADDAAVSSGETKTQQSPVEEAPVADFSNADEQIKESRDRLEQVMAQIKENTKDMSFSIDMRYDERINRTIAKIVDKETGSVIKEIPPEELVNVAVMIKEMSEGIIIDNQA